jgi:glycosyltransferase involved in cell wall biosynthesis
MISEAERLGVLDKFIFTGFLRGDERDQIYQTADLYVMPSVSEPFGITALESVVNGTPVLISKQSGVSEILKNALKVDFWDTDEIANKVLAVLKYGALPKDLREESGKEVKLFSWSRAANDVIDVYSQLIR